MCQVKGLDPNLPGTDRSSTGLASTGERPGTAGAAVVQMLACRDVGAPRDAPRRPEKKEPVTGNEPSDGLLDVGATGFEPATTCTPSKCATRLRYAPGTEGADT
jgi:hypothetical protein